MWHFISKYTTIFLLLYVIYHSGLHPEQSAHCFRHLALGFFTPPDSLRATAYEHYWHQHWRSSVRWLLSIRGFFYSYTLPYQVLRIFSSHSDHNVRKRQYDTILLNIKIHMNEMIKQQVHYTLLLALILLYFYFNYKSLKNFSNMYSYIHTITTFQKVKGIYVQTSPLNSDMTKQYLLKKIRHCQSSWSKASQVTSIISACCPFKWSSANNTRVSSLWPRSFSFYQGK